MNEIVVGLTGKASNVDEMRDVLSDIEYNEVSSLSMTGIEDGIIWLIPLVLASPVITKVIDVLSSSKASKVIEEISISADGDVIIKGASAKKAAEFLKEMNSN